MNIAVVIALLYILAVGLALCLAFAARRIRRSRPVAVGVFLLGSVLAALHADKPTPVPSALLRWDRGLADNGSIATNDTVFIRGTYDPLMANDALHVDYRDRTITDSPDGWARAYDGAVGDLADGFTVTIQDATNMVVWIWSEYVEPAPTHTNGEYRIIYVGRIDGGAADAPRYVTPRTPIKGEARCSARDYVQDGLIAMWDGIENAGWGVHNPNATEWKDLVGDNDITLVGGVFGDTALICNGTQYGGHNDNVVNGVQIELVANAKQQKRRCWIASTGQSLSSKYSGFVGWYDRGLCFGLYDTARSLTLGTAISYSFAVNSNRTFENNALVATESGKSDLTPQAARGICVVVGGQMNNPLKCDIHCLRIYSRALTDEEIAHNYKIDSIRFGLPGAPSAVVPLSPPSLPPPAQSLFSTLATENLTE